MLLGFGWKGAGWRGEIKCCILNFRGFSGCAKGQVGRVCQGRSRSGGYGVVWVVLVLADGDISSFFLICEPQGEVSAQGGYFDCTNGNVLAP